MALLVTHTRLITWDDPNSVIEDGALLIDGSTIRAVGASSELEAQYPDAERLDARGQLAMPGNICAHTHFYGAYARGLAIPGPAPKDFPEILQRLWWPLDKALDEQSVRFSALVCLVDAIKHGTTTLIDHHASPNFIDGSLDVIADAVDEAGLRGVLCYEVTDRDGEAKAQAGIAENARFLSASKDRPLIGATFGLHAGLTLSDTTLEACATAADGLDTGFHIHVAEHEADEEDSLSKWGQRVVPRLERLGILGPKTIVAHAVHVDEAERAILKDSGAWVSHQPRSNMNNAVGASAFDAMLVEGIKVVLGNDGFSNNMWADWKAAYLLHKVANRDPRRAPGDAIAHVATWNNARLAEQFFPGETLGKLVPGAAADVILVDYRPFTPLHAGNVPWHILFGFESSMVTTTIVAGRVLMRDRQLLTLDEGAIAAAALDYAPHVWERYNYFVSQALDS
ncbi:putative aminohydrolase SsnA [Aggregatilinea lenta]|uniref:putative aminohydrolase SsnA n=1 Tax=Aggregatilinea lenta TaxID=913108 RepID=UPI001EE99C30|nr:putative aminohydrolase SsnA [Aggregatilinea lenta]